MNKTKYGYQFNCLYGSIGLNVLYEPKAVLDPNPSTIISYRVKNSKRWIETRGVVTPIEFFPMPYINAKGYTINSATVRWRTHPENVLSTIISTKILRTINRWISLKGKRNFRKIRSKLVACATIGSFYSNSTFDRIFNLLLRNEIKHANDLMNFLSIKLDRDTRFVFCHAIKQAKWLNSRSASSKPCRRSYESMFSHFYPPFRLDQLMRSDEYDFTEYTEYDYLRAIYRSVYRITQLSFDSYHDWSITEI